jgi:dephospho-CoA kinase
MIIGLVGEKLSGKDTVAEYLVKQYGAAHVRTSHILDELLKVLGLPITRRNEIEAGRGMEMVFGDKVIGEALVKRINTSNAPMVVNNGLRQEYQFKDAQAMGAKIIYVTAPAELRYQRSVKRSSEQKDDGHNIDQFLEQDKEWIESQIPRLGASADFRVENTGSLQDLYKKIDEIINPLLTTHGNS